MEKSTLSSVIPDNLKIPTGKIQLQEKLGEGGFGFVHKGVWIHTSRHCTTVAVKTLKARNLSPIAMKSFAHEIDVHSKLDSDYIVKIYGVIPENPAAIVLEFCPNLSLDKYLRQHNRDTVSWDLRFNWIFQIASGLNTLHTQNPIIIHSDIKSLNVLLTQDLSAKLTDFGLAKLKSESSSSQYHTGQDANTIKGTMLWLAPELINGNSRRSIATDMYSYGLVCYEIASHKYPLEDTGNMGLMLARKIMGNLDEFPEDTPEHFKSIGEECSQNEPKLRLSTKQVLDRLEKNKPRMMSSGNATSTEHHTHSVNVSNSDLEEHIIDRLGDFAALQKFINDNFGQKSSEIPDKTIINILAIQLEQYIIEKNLGCIIQFEQAIGKLAGLVWKSVDYYTIKKQVEDCLDPITFKRSVTYLELIHWFDKLNHSNNPVHIKLRNLPEVAAFEEYLQTEIDHTEHSTSVDMPRPHNGDPGFVILSEFYSHFDIILGRFLKHAAPLVFCEQKAHLYIKQQLQRYQFGTSQQSYDEMLAELASFQWNGRSSELKYVDYSLLAFLSSEKLLTQYHINQLSNKMYEAIEQFDLKHIRLFNKAIGNHRDKLWKTQNAQDLLNLLKNLEVPDLKPSSGRSYLVMEDISIWMDSLEEVFLRESVIELITTTAGSEMSYDHLEATDPMPSKLCSFLFEIKKGIKNQFLTYLERQICLASADMPMNSKALFDNCDFKGIADLLQSSLSSFENAVLNYDNNCSSTPSNGTTLQWHKFILELQSTVEKQAHYLNLENLRIIFDTLDKFFPHLKDELTSILNISTLNEEISKFKLRKITASIGNKITFSALKSWYNNPFKDFNDINIRHFVFLKKFANFHKNPEIYFQIIQAISFKAEYMPGSLYYWPYPNYIWQINSDHYSCQEIQKESQIIENRFVDFFNDQITQVQNLLLLSNFCNTHSNENLNDNHTSHYNR